MRWSIRLGTGRGIRIEVHVTFLLMLAGVAFFHGSRSAGRLAHAAAQRRRPGFPRRLPPCVLHLVLLFACVLLHELGHALNRAALRHPHARDRATSDRRRGAPGAHARKANRRSWPWPSRGPAVNVVLATVLGAVLFAAGTPAVHDPRARRGQRERWSSCWSPISRCCCSTWCPRSPWTAAACCARGSRSSCLRARHPLRLAWWGKGSRLLFAVVGIFVLRNPLLVFIALFVFVTAGEEPRAGAAHAASLTACR